MPMPYNIMGLVQRLFGALPDRPPLPDDPLAMLMSQSKTRLGSLPQEYLQLRDQLWGKGQGAYSTPSGSSAPDVGGLTVMPNDERFKPEPSPLETPTPSPSSGGSFNVDALSQGVRERLPLIQEAASKTGVPASVLAAIMSIESGGRNVESPAGAVGPMQVMPFNAGSYNLWNPSENILRGAQMLAERHQKWGDWGKAAASYFGALSPSGEITNARDVGGQTGTGYVNAFQNVLGKLGGIVDAAAKVVSNYAFPVENFKGSIQPHWGNPEATGGADIFAKAGTPVFAMAEGNVLNAGYSPVGGYNVTLRDPSGREYYYAHLLENPYVHAGQTVNPGLTIGKIGTTGNAVGTPPHLHIGIGNTIRTGTGAFGGVGQGFNAVDFLRGLLNA